MDFICFIFFPRALTLALRLMLIIWCSFVPVNHARSHSWSVLYAIFVSKWRCGWSARIRALPAQRNSIKTIQADRRRRSEMISGDLRASRKHERGPVGFLMFWTWSWSKTVKRAGPHRGLRFLPTHRGAQTVPQAREHGPVRREVHAGGHLLPAAGETVLVNIDVECMSSLLWKCVIVQALCIDYRDRSRLFGSDLRGWCQRACW